LNFQVSTSRVVVDKNKDTETLQGVIEEGNRPCVLVSSHLWIVAHNAAGNSYEYFNPDWLSTEGSSWSVKVPFIEGGDAVALTGGDDCLQSFEQGTLSDGHYSHSTNLKGCVRWGVAEDAPKV